MTTGTRCRATFGRSIMPVPRPAKLPDPQVPTAAPHPPTLPFEQIEPTTSISKRGRRSTFQLRF